MTYRTDAARGREIVARWCSLAEQRLEYLTEMFETGRWRRFHTEFSFLQNVKEAKAAVATWRDLLAYETSLTDAPIDLTWLGRARAVPPRQARRPDLPPLAVSQVPRISVEPASNVVPLALVAEKSTPVVAALDAPAPRPVPSLDLAVMQERYPLLRNAM